jgi:hypothetical protein
MQGGSLRSGAPRRAVPCLWEPNGAARHTKAERVVRGEGPRAVSVLDLDHVKVVDVMFPVPRDVAEGSSTPTD